MACSSVCSLERRVEVHHLLDGRVEAGEEHVADNEDLERVVLLQEALDQLLALARAPARTAQVLGSLFDPEMITAHCGAVEPVERSL
jgi:hypothetical protein